MLMHTFECTYPMTGKEYSKLNNSLKSSAFCKDYHTTGRLNHIFKGLCKNGIAVKILGREVPMATVYGIDYGVVYLCVFRINPTRLYQPNNYFGLYDTSLMNQTIDTINSLLRSASEYFPDIRDCKLSRFDFCTNIELENEQSVKDAIRLINSSVANARFKQTMAANSRTFTAPELEATFRRSNYVEISFYNKNEQMKQRNLLHDKLPNILRCEIRCLWTYIAALCNKFRCRHRSLVEFFDKADEIGKYVYRHQLERLKLTRDFYKLQTLKAIINSSSKQTATKQYMTNISCEAAKRRNFMKVYDNIDNSEEQKIERHFKDLNISSMPIPVHAKLPDGMNFYEMCKESMGNNAENI